MKNNFVMLTWGPWSWFISTDLIQNINQFSLAHRLILLIVQALPLSITIIICHKLAKLFQLYEQSHLFEEENIQLIKHISIFMILGEFGNLIFQPLMTIALTFNNPVGQRFISLTFGSTNLSTLITGFLILVASWIVKEAYQLKTDARLTI